jgi:hypothetical protein
VTDFLSPVAATAPGPFARIEGQPAPPQFIPGITDPAATAPPILNAFPPNQIQIPMPVNPPMGGPPLPFPPPQPFMGGPPPPIPPMQQSFVPPFVGGPLPIPQFGGQPPLPMPVPTVPPVPPIPPMMLPGPDPIRRPPPVQSIMTPKLPPAVIIAAFTLLLGIIAEVDIISKYAGTQYAGPGGGTALQKLIVLLVLGVGATVLFFVSYDRLFADLLTVGR